MAAAILEVADELVTKLNGGSFSTSFTAVRLFVPDFDRSNELDALKVSVVPRDIQMEILSRNKTKQTVTIDVAIQQAVDNSFSQVDTLLSLVDEIDLFMRFVTLGGSSEASWIDTSPNPYYAISHREEIFVFTSVLQFTFIFFR